jgi:hypothetical protein
MRDLELVKRKLKETDLTLVIVKGNEVLFEDNSPGIIGFLRAIETLKEKLAMSSVGDRVVGKAIAMLCAYSKVKSVYAITLSEGGKKTLENFGIPYEFENLVSKILDMKKKDICPFEKLTAHVSSPEEAYERFKAHVKKEAL